MRRLWGLRRRVALFACWLVVSALCVRSAVDEVRLNSRGVRVPAVAHETRVHRETRRFLLAYRDQRVGFVTRDGRPMTVTVDHYGWGVRPSAGDRVEVEYDERDPATARYAGDHGDAGAAVVMAGIWLAVTVRFGRRVKRSLA